MNSIAGDTIMLTRGDTLVLTLTCYNEDDNSVYTPQAGDVFSFAVKHSTMTPGKTEFTDNAPLFVKYVNNSTMQFTITPNDTKLLGFGTYTYDVQFTGANGMVCTIIDDAKLILTPEVH